MKILITGSNGMLGRALCETLRSGHELIGTDINVSDGPDKFYIADLREKHVIDDMFGKERPDIIIHAAAWTDVDGCEDDPEKAREMNVEVTKNVAEAAGKNGSFLIYISTDFVFNGKKNIPYTEEDETAPVNVYGQTKLDGEHALARLERYAIVRTSWLFGGNGKNFVDTMVNAGKAEKVIKVVDDQIGSPTYARDLAVALKKIVERPENSAKEIFHVSNSGQCSWHEFAKEILRNNVSIQISPITSEELNRPAPRPKFSVLDNSKFERFTGHKMRPWQKALGEYLRAVNSLKG
ncbi:MAG: dTDP-4-dehydrorhamnose reductase [Candidatus Omnitrophota bacterium]|nr:dTDP-4-dehydrorhamnose reductase [Candidatus Omnitrophota bacterium]